MLSLDRFLRRRRAFVLLAWAVLIAVAVPFALHQSDRLTGGGFAIPGSQSDQVRRALAEQIPGGDRARLSAVLVPARDATPAQLRAAVGRLDRAAARVPKVALTPAAAQRARAQAGKPATLVVPLEVRTSEDKSTDVATDLRTRLRVGEARAGVTAHLAGQGALWAGLQDLTKSDLRKAESVGFPLVLLILLAVFGSLAAAALPLALGAGSVVLTGSLIYLLSRSMEMSVFVTNMASMIGIGVAVDYSLFVLARYREEIAAGRDREAARGVALATSGLAVLFSGLTVVVSLGGLWMIDNAAIRSMALGAMLVVAVSVLASATLLPALISLLGDRVAARGRVFTFTGLLVRSRRRRRAGSTRPEHIARGNAWDRWTRRVTARPGLSAGLSAAILLTLALPALFMQTNAGALRQFAPHNETRLGAEAAARVVGAGAASPAQVVAHYGTDARAKAATLRTEIARDPGVARVSPPVLGRDRRTVALAVVPRAQPESNAARAMVDRLRAKHPEIRVGGSTAGQLDFKRLVAGSLWKILLFVLALSYVVLLVLLRSVVLPLKAVLVNLLSVGASYGVLVAVFQWGWLDGLLGWSSPGDLDVLTPPLVLAVVFGLSMDYEVFLLSRIRERHHATGDTRTAVAEGLAASARTITSAALIMVCVFSIFVFTGVPSIKELGLGNAVAIAVDATLVRLVLVPAAMELLGDWNWWLPRPLARILPRADLESLPPAAAETAPERPDRPRVHA